MTDLHDHLTESDELRPEKKMKLDGASPRSADSGESDWDALYGVQKDEDAAKSKTLVGQADDSVEGSQEKDTLLASETNSSHAEIAEASHGSGTLLLQPPETRPSTAMVDNEGDHLVAGSNSKLVSSDAASTHMGMEVAEVTAQPERIPSAELDQTMDEGSYLSAQPSDPRVSGAQFAAVEADLNSPGEDLVDHDSGLVLYSEETKDLDPKSGLVLYNDENINVDPTGETAPDSDPESSSDDSSSDSDDDSDTASMVMDPAELRAMLERGDAEDDGDRGGGGPPRTVHELKEDIPAKPDITITATTLITPLGTVMHFAENRLVISGQSGMTFEKVPAIGSPLCNADREVIGAISDVMGTTSSPFFLAILAESELAALNLQQGATVFYVDEYSKFDSVVELRAMKHTDASNLHDEEVGYDEEEFSDDEKEAEYKKLNKQSKKGGLGKLSRADYVNNDRSGQYDQYRDDRGGRGRGRGRGGRGDRSRGRGGRGGREGHGDDDGGYPRYSGNYHGDNMPDVRVELTYGDDDRQADRAVSPLGPEGYTPLKRPDNLSQLMQSGAPSTNADRGGQRSRGQDRGRARGGNERGSRGGSNSNYRSGRGAPYVPHPLPQMPPAPLPQQQQTYAGHTSTPASGYNPTTATNYTQQYQQPQYNPPATATANPVYQHPAQAPAWQSYYQPNTSSTAAPLQQQVYNAHSQQQVYGAQPQQQHGQYQFQGQMYQYPPAGTYAPPQPQTQQGYQQTQQGYTQPPGGAYNPNFAQQQWGQQGQQGQQGQ